MKKTLILMLIVLNFSKIYANDNFLSCLKNSKSNSQIELLIYYKSDCPHCDGGDIHKILSQYGNCGTRDRHHGAYLADTWWEGCATEGSKCGCGIALHYQTAFINQACGSIE